jgi:hypothetical protein
LVAHLVEIRQVINTQVQHATAALDAMVIGIKFKPGLPNMKDLLAYIRTICIRSVIDRPMSQPHIWIPHALSRSPTFRTAWNFLIPIKKRYWYIAENALPYDSQFDPYATITHSTAKTTHHFENGLRSLGTTKENVFLPE